MEIKELRVLNKDGVFVVDSREVAEMVGKEHKNLLRDIKGYVEILDGSTLSTPNFFIESTYINTQNKIQPCYLLTKKGCDMVANKMTGEKGVLFTATYVSRFDEMEKELKSSVYRVPKSFKEALALALEQQEQIESLEKEVSEKEDIIIGLTENITLAEKRQILNRVVRKDNNYQERWGELYKQFEMKFHMNLKVRMDKYNSEHKPKVKNKIDYIEKVLNMIPELYEIAVKLYENDVKSLVKEMYELQSYGV